jgi:ankyrin repeat protein
VGRKNVVAYLTDVGVVAGEQDINGMSPLATHLQQMSMNGTHTTETMEVLLGAGANPAYVSNEGLGSHHMYAQTALMPGIEPFKVLQKYGLDITTPDNGGRSLLHYCAINGHCTMEFLDFSTGLGIPLQSFDATGITPLQYANIETLRVRDVYEWDSDRWGLSRATPYDYVADGTT